jgi:hypothetical protein
MFLPEACITLYRLAARCEIVLKSYLNGRFSSLRCGVNAATGRSQFLKDLFVAERDKSAADHATLDVLASKLGSIFYLRAILE